MSTDQTIHWSELEESKFVLEWIATSVNHQPWKRTSVVIPVAQRHSPRADIWVVARSLRMLLHPIPPSKVSATSYGVVLIVVGGICGPECSWSDVIIQETRARDHEQRQVILVSIIYN